MVNRHLIIVIMVIMGGASCRNANKKIIAETSLDTIIRVNAPEFPQYTDWLNTDKPYKLSDFRGKFVLLDFWTYCCINCMHVLPDLKKLEKEFAELVVIGVHSAKFEGEKSTDNIKEAILRYDIEHPVINDYKFELWDQYAVKAWPTFVLIDPDGKVVSTVSGEGVYGKLKPFIEKLSAEFSEKGKLNKEPFTFNLVKFNESRSLLSFPGKLATDEKGKRLFISDSNNDRIVIVSPAGEILEVIGAGVAGNEDGDFENAKFYRPQGLAYDGVKNVLYIADTENHLIRMADLNTKKVITLLGTGKQAGKHLSRGKGRELAINSPWDVALNGKDELVIAMAGMHQLWKLNVNSLEAEVLAGTGGENIVDGDALQAKLAQPSGLTGDGKSFYFADSEVSAIRKLSDSKVKTLAGEGLFKFGDVDGSFPVSRLQHPLGVLYHDGLLYVADTYNNKIKTLDPNSTELKTLAGTGESGMTDGALNSATLNEPNDIAFLAGKFYITDTNNGLIRVLDPKKKTLSTLKLTNMKMLKTKVMETEFSGKKVTLPAAVIGTGKGVITFTPIFKPGFEFNTEAPNYFVLKSSNGKVLKTLSYDENVAAVPFTIPVEATAGTAIFTMEAEIYYCEHTENARCYVERVLFNVPLEVKKGAGSSLKLEYAF